MSDEIILGRPRKKLNAEEITDLSSKGMTVQKIAAVCDVSEATLYRRYDKAIKKGWALRNSTLQERQFQVAQSGNPALLIWLGKNWLDQTDKQELTGKDGAPLAVFTNVSLPSHE